MTINTVKDTVKVQLGRLRSWVRAKPKVAGPILGGVTLLALLVISTLVALVVQNNRPEVAPRSGLATAKIDISKDGFVPATLVVKKGTKIIWTNTDSETHQIYANPHPTGESLPGLKSEILNNAQVYEYTADTAGIYGYHDQLSPTTNGTIEVKE